MFSDLECDYINPIDLCNKLNQVGSPLLGVFTSTDILVVCLARKLGARLPHLVIPTVGPMDSVPPQRAFSCIQRQQVRSFKATCSCSNCCFVESGIKIICTTRQKSSGH